MMYYFFTTISVHSIVTDSSGQVTSGFSLKMGFCVWACVKLAMNSILALHQQVLRHAECLGTFCLHDDLSSGICRAHLERRVYRRVISLDPCHVLSR